MSFRDQISRLSPRPGLAHVEYPQSIEDKHILVYKNPITCNQSTSAAEDIWKQLNPVTEIRMDIKRGALTLVSDTLNNSSAMRTLAYTHAEKVDRNPVEGTQLMTFALHDFPGIIKSLHCKVSQEQLDFFEAALTHLFGHLEKLPANGRGR